MTMTGTMRDVAFAGTGFRYRGLGLALAVVLLAGCPGPTVTTDQGSIRATAPGDGGKLALARPPRPKVKPPVGNDAVARVAPAAIGAPGQAVAATGPVDPEALVGLDQNQTRHLLGVPAGTAEEATAKVWRYANDACTLKVFFYMDMTSKDFRALSYDMKSSENVPDVDQRCFAHLLAQAGGSHD